jgi:hypothetical protein
MKDMNDNNSSNPDLLHALRASCGNLPICLDEEDETETQPNPVIAGVDFSSSLNLLSSL